MLSYKGFTVVETLIILVIFTIALLAVFPLYSSGTMMNIKAGEKAFALYLLEQAAELYENYKWDIISDGDTNISGTLDGAETAATLYEDFYGTSSNVLFYRTITIEPGSALVNSAYKFYKLIDIDVHWPGATGANSVKLDLLRGAWLSDENPQLLQ